MSEPLVVPAQPSAALPPASPSNKTKIPIGLIAGVVAMVAVLFLPLSDTLPIAGHRMLATLVFAVVVWITEAVSYEASAIMITTLMAFLLGTAPTLQDPNVVYGTSQAISMALAGFSNSALALVAGALFIAAAMTFTNCFCTTALNATPRYHRSSSSRVPSCSSCERRRNRSQAPASEHWVRPLMGPTAAPPSLPA